MYTRRDSVFSRILTLFRDSRILSIITMKRNSFIFSTLAVLVALNYFSFRVELFGDEYNDNHPPISSSSSFTLPSINWETFDKDNAPQAIILTPDLHVSFLLLLEKQIPEIAPEYVFIHPVRDKSPPVHLYSL